MRWNKSSPIYLQIKDKICCAILDGHLKEGDNVTSIREFSSQYHVNPLTVSKAYQLLVDEDILLKRRGLGMVVNANAQQKLLKQQRQQFIENEWPSVLATIKRLKLNIEELLS